MSKRVKSAQALADLAARRARGDHCGITSVCSAHPVVIEAALRHGRDAGEDVLIEATCNQVNQDGGYTGMTPRDFRSFVEGVARRVGFDRSRLILGGDHLGPNPWRGLPAEDALRKAEAMIAAFVEAGFVKLHLDASMGCRGEGAALPDVETAARAARLAAVAEAAARRAGAALPVYVVGTEVPMPGGARETLDPLQVTTPAAAVATIEAHREAFGRHGLQEAFARVIAVVVQPGVEFGSEDVVVYAPDRARALSAVLDRVPGLVFEAHSTDYQPPAALRALVGDGFAILKVGPSLTFALREALYALSGIAAALERGHGDDLPPAMDRIMTEDPAFWLGYYPGDETRQYRQRHFSYSDRIRYYWPRPAAQAAVDRLMARLSGVIIPAPLVSQYLGALGDDVAQGRVPADPHSLVVARISRVLADYGFACAARPRLNG